MRISIIIPTLNEELYLPKLLESIRRQTFRGYEVIVADARSKDKTAEIARKYRARVVKGGSPAAGRNSGAKAAKGDFLFFFDADVKLPKDFLEKAHHEIQKKYLDLATCEFEPLSNQPIDEIIFDLANLSVKLSQRTQPRAPGFCILISRRLFNRVKGFDETLKMAEDHNLVKRASKFRPLHILESAKIKVSIRRLTKEGRINLIKKYLKVELYRIFRGELKREIIKYEFGKFGRKRKKLAKLERQINNINRDLNKLRKYFSAEEIKENYTKTIEKIKSEIKEIKNFFNFKK